MGPEFDAWIKNLQEGGIFTDIHQLWQKFGELLERALKDAGERTIVTKFGDSSFKTTVALDNDITNEFPETGPKDDDIYWKRHQELVDNILNTRKEIVLKIIETVGVTIKGVINTISVSNVDIAKIIENFTKKQ